MLAWLNSIRFLRCVGGEKIRPRNFKGLATLDGWKTSQIDGQVHRAGDFAIEHKKNDFALAGVMDDENAAKGVLVTTSWVGKASRDFAARNGSRIEIIEGRHLKSLLRQHLGLDALIGLPKLPPGWERHEVS